MSPKPSLSRKGSEPVVRLDKGKASTKPVKSVKTTVPAKMDRQASRSTKPVKHVKTVVTTKVDKVIANAAPVKQVKTVVSTKVDKNEVAKGQKSIKKFQAVIRAAPRRKLDLTPQDFDAMFLAEIDEEVNRPASVHQDRFVRWRCQCCDAMLRVPRRAMVLHGEYVLVHDDQLGLLVNGERWVPKSDSEGGLQLVQPGRLKDPFTGSLLKTTKYAV